MQFGSGSDEEEDEEAARVREERLAAYAAKKSKKPGVIAKTRWGNVEFPLKMNYYNVFISGLAFSST